MISFHLILHSELSRQNSHFQIARKLAALHTPLTLQMHPINSELERLTVYAPRLAIDAITKRVFFFFLLSGITKVKIWSWGVARRRVGEFFF